MWICNDILKTAKIEKEQGVVNVFAWGYVNRKCHVCFISGAKMKQALETLKTAED